MSKDLRGNQRLADDVRATRELSSMLDERLARNPEDSRLLVVLSAGGKADQFYRPALDRLALQAEQVGLRLQILLGCNNGADFPADWAPAGTAVRHLHAEAKADPVKPALVHEDPGLSSPFTLRAGHGSGHELFAVHQPACENAAGKIRMLNDLYGMLLRSVAYGGNLPHRTLLVDAESHFHRLPVQRTDAPDEDSNGLALLLAHLHGPEAVRMVGAVARNTAFRLVPGVMERVPDFATPISFQHRALNATHGLHRHQSLLGGGIAGRTADVVALGSAVSKYPGLRSEDAAEALLASHAGIPWSVATDVSVTNFCPPMSDRAAVIDQLARWSAAPRALRDLYGTNEYGDLSLRQKLASMYHDLAYLIRSGTLLGTIRDKFGVRLAVKRLPPESPLHGPAAWKTAS